MLGVLFTYQVKPRERTKAMTNKVHKAVNPIIRKWEGMTDQEWAELRYTARKHLDERMKRVK